MTRTMARGVAASIAIALIPLTAVALAPNAVADDRPTVSVSAEAIPAGVVVADVTPSAEAALAAAGILPASEFMSGDDEYWFDNAVSATGPLALRDLCSDLRRLFSWDPRSVQASA